MKKIVLAALIAFPLAASAVDLVSNGSFEANPQAANSYSINANLVGWAGHEEIELRNDLVGSAFDGANFVELDANRNSSMTQTLVGAAGRYLLSFWYSARPNTAAGTNGLSFSLDGGSFVGTVLTGVGNSGNSHDWQQFSSLVDFDGNAVLEFAAGESSDSYGGSLDKVAFTSAVPETDTYALLLAGFGVVATIARRRRRAI